MPPVFPPLDEEEWSDPNWLKNFFPNEGPRPTIRTILWYFYASPFYDEPIAANTSLLKGRFDRPDRERLENDVYYFQQEMNALTTTGVMFMVTSEPKEEGQPWVIQRQHKRYKLNAQGEETSELEIVVEGTFYVTGTRISMAPSLLDVMRSRLLSVTHRIQEVLDMSSSLTQWAPATGHTYQLPSYAPAKDKTRGLGSMSRLGTPGFSDIELSQTQTSTQPTAPPSEQSTTVFNNNFFEKSLALTMKYGGEYMDENPLQGEPGAFVYSSSKQQVEERNKAREAQTAASALAAPARAAEGATPVSSVAPTPKPLADAASRKGSVAIKTVPGKEKRRKSKGGLLSPTSPTGPTAP